MVYVDDFKMAGPEKEVSAMWETLKNLPQGKELILGDPEPLNQFLGCNHIEEKKQVSGRAVRGVRYDMSKFLGQCIETYKELAGPEWVLKHADTPFLDEEQIPNPARTPAEAPNGGYVCPYCTEAFPKEQFTEVKDSREAKEVCERLRKTQQGVPVGHDKNLNGSASGCNAATDEPGVLDLLQRRSS